MFIKVESETCIACGLCQLKAPDLFHYDENGVAYLNTEKIKTDTAVPVAFITQAKQAIVACPVGAIKHSEHPFS